MTPYTLRDWQGFLRAAGRADLAESPLVTDPARRNAEIGALYAQLAEILKERDTEEWIAIARAVGIPVAAVRSLEETIADGDLQAAGYLVDYDHPDVGRLSGPAALVRSEDGATAPVRPAPRLGQDTADMLRAIGYSEEDVNRLRASGVAGVA
jgi:crotonobetainyl-CoA:carnitine CoA-transferase CaiB-like acyl-CoA transferase